MKSVAFFVLFVTTMLVAIVFGEPIRPRSRTFAKQTVGNGPAENDINGEQTPEDSVKSVERPYVVVKSYPSGALLVVPLDQPRADSTAVESTTSYNDQPVTTDSSANVNAGAPYSPNGWIPAGRLLLLPNEKVTATTTEVPATTEQPCVPSNQFGRLQTQTGEQEEIAVADNEPYPPNAADENDDAEEIITPQPKKQNKNGKLQAGDATESSNNSNDSTESQPSSTTSPSSKLETTSEPDAEAVDVGQQPQPQGRERPAIAPSNPGAFVVQLPDGSLQRFVFVATPNGLVPVSRPPFQQLVQPQIAQVPQSYPQNSIASPRVVTFSSQYQSF